MKNLTLKHLRYFDALARYQHFGRAAEACSISQPALSLQVKELEAVFDTALVERSAPRIRLTTAGRDFISKGRLILLAVEELEDLMRASKNPLSGRLRLGIIPTVAPYLLPEIILALSERYPGLELEVRETKTKSLIEDLSGGLLDFAVVALPISEANLKEFALFEEEFALVRPKGDAEKQIPSPKLLQTMRLLLLEEGHCFRDQALSVCQISKARPQQLMEGNSLSTLVQMVGAGMGVTLIPEIAISLEARSSDVSIVRFPNPAPKRTIGMVWRTTNPLSVQLTEIGEIIRSVGQKKRDSNVASAEGLLGY
jgi:LysR family hydrogen peroxide-inducible transcriptional activator